MKVLLLGSGGREHALAWKISQSSILDELYIAPGNAGTRQFGKNIPISPIDFNAVKQFVLENSIEMVVVGPEEPLVLGIYDFFIGDSEINKIPVIGPSKFGAQLEGSKDFAKAFMNRHSIPTAKYATFTLENLEEGLTFLKNMKSPYVLKADGLAAGKGVLIIHDLDEAQAELKSMLQHEKFGEASKKVVIEQFLDGIELSVFIVTDGHSFKLLPEAKDYKRIGEGDTGPNTGGMGAISPVPFADAAFMDKVHNRIIVPTVKGLKSEGIVYKGFVFFGLICVKGDPYVIEYNCRMGDPETETVIPRIESDLVELFLATAQQRLHEKNIIINPKSVATVIAVSGGYPEEYEKGKEIKGLNKLTITDGMLFHCGTLQKNELTVTNGGRVIAATSYGQTIKEAVKSSINTLQQLNYDGMYYRTDIGYEFE